MAASRIIHQLGCALTVLALAPLGVVCSGLVGLGWFAESPGLFLLAVVLASSATVPWTMALLWLDRHEKEPWWLLGGAFAWGAIVATAWSGLANSLFFAVVHALTGAEQASWQITASVSAPVVEELSKGVAIAGIALVFRHHFDNVLDGMIYGAMVGMGFAWFENITYYMQSSEEGVGSMVQLSVVRGVFNGVSTHATFSALAGVGFGYARLASSRWKGWLAIGASLLLAMGAHVAWNSFSGVIAVIPGDGASAFFVGVPLAMLVLALPFGLLLLAVLGMCWAHENRVIVEHLADEAPEVCAPSTLRELVPARRRSMRGARRLLTEGPGSWWRTRRRHQALVDLAFAKWHASREGREGPDPTVVALRERLRRMAGA